MHQNADPRRCVRYGALDIQARLVYLWMGHVAIGHHHKFIASQGTLIVWHCHIDKNSSNAFSMEEAEEAAGGG